MNIRLIKSEEAYSIRHKVLRPNQSLESCKYPDDDNEKSFHFGYFEKKELISIASFYEEKTNYFDSNLTQYRLRGMATLAEYRKRNIASKLISKALVKLKEKRVNILWCNARTTAFNFYKKNNFKEVGSIFEIKGIGPHKVMFKVI